MEFLAATNHRVTNFRTNHQPAQPAQHPFFGVSATLLDQWVTSMGSLPPTKTYQLGCEKSSVITLVPGSFSVLRLVGK